MRNVKYYQIKGELNRSDRNSSDDLGDFQTARDPNYILGANGIITNERNLCIDERNISHVLKGAQYTT